ncbi:hypothetical protein [Serratia marcescens]|uniref:hypothetical protein n=1 Tax=Serratia marcescens TaxID=615 RepID=UPI00044D4874|nr:hypothetical protein [Serratia marcescens]EZQ69430.1 hypothetical protein AF53_03097 [Serratia marcescens BIDMC 80]
MKNIVENQGIKTDKPLPMSYEALKAERDALAVENAALKDGFEWLYAVVSSDEVSIPDEKYSAVTNAAAVLSETPATDAALAAIQAQGVEKFADDLHKTAMAMCSVKPDNTTPGAYARLARSFAKKLREAK